MQKDSGYTGNVKMVQLGRRRPERRFKVVVKEEMRRHCGDV